MTLASGRKNVGLLLCIVNSHRKVVRWAISTISLVFFSVRLNLFLPLQGKNIIVFYGSQTGTAEEFANRLSKDAQRYGMKGMAADPEEYEMVT